MLVNLILMLIPLLLVPTVSFLRNQYILLMFLLLLQSKSLDCYCGDPKTGKSYHLILNKCLYMGNSMNHSLLNPNQLCHNGLIAQDTATMFDRTSTQYIYDSALGGTVAMLPNNQGNIIAAAMK
jgi:hypothetical protein